MKYTSVPGLGLQPNPAAVAIYDTTADGQSNTGAWILSFSTVRKTTTGVPPMHWQERD
jgi:hypothetical protein